ncbi:MAG TPA: hypothetical protein VFB74_04915 [Kribbellaceae bacterium]|nr:hypothetical protein [Kribbellaceae bacterium]
MRNEDRPTEAEAQRSADRLALALEDVGFDVGQEFPALHDAIGRQGFAVVRLGDIRPATADRLVTLLARAAAQGITSAEEDNT